MIVVLVIVMIVVIVMLVIVMLLLPLRQHGDKSLSDMMVSLTHKTSTITKESVSCVCLVCWTRKLRTFTAVIQIVSLLLFVL